MTTNLVAPCVLDAVIQSCLDHHVVTDEPNRVACEALRKKVFSKYSTGTISATAESRALDKFLKGCEASRLFKVSASNLFEEHLLGSFRHRCNVFFDGIDPDNFSLANLHSLGGAGPGKSIKAYGTDFLRKFYYGPVSATSVDVIHSYLRGSRSNPLDFHAAKRGMDLFGYYVEDCSRLSFVEKNVDEARTIATEPSVNMFYQLAIGSVINRRLGEVYKWSVSSTPDRNRAFAYRGSVDGLTATVDLQSASDSISLDLCRYSLPGYLFDLMALFRCSRSRLPDGRVLTLPMVSTMGNGWTFSLMTALIYCALHACCDVVGSEADLKSCSVFGDDIICPVHMYGAVVRLLGCLGFVVNKGKSYSEGSFRESCGHDFYAGRFVRPVYIRRLDTTHSHYVAFNRLAEWGSLHSVSMVPALKLLAKSVPRILVPSHFDYASGFKVSSASARHLLTKNGTWRVKHVESVPLSYDVQEMPKRVRTLDPRVNPDGIYVSFLGGYLRNSKVSERSEKKVRWRLTTRITPNWDTRDSIPYPGWDEGAERRWKAIVGSIFD